MALYGFYSNICFYKNLSFVAMLKVLQPVTFTLWSGSFVGDWKLKYFHDPQRSCKEKGNCYFVNRIKHIDTDLNILIFHQMLQERMLNLQKLFATSAVMGKCYSKGIWKKLHLDYKKMILILWRPDNQQTKTSMSLDVMNTSISTLYMTWNNKHNCREQWQSCKTTEALNTLHKLSRRQQQESKLNFFPILQEWCTV